MFFISRFEGLGFVLFFKDIKGIGLFIRLNPRPMRFLILGRSIDYLVSPLISFFLFSTRYFLSLTSS